MKQKVSLSMMITSLLVQSYITVSRMYAISDKLYRHLKSTGKNRALKAPEVPVSTTALD